VGVKSAGHVSSIHLQSFHLNKINTRSNKVWKRMWAAIVTEIWSQRSKVVFSNGKADYLEIFSFA